jgi:hypothetical protein
VGLVGRYRPRVEPLWSGFVRRTEFVTGIYEGAAVPVLLATLTGTPLLGPLLRLFGAKVGRRTLIDTTYLTEFDLVDIGDDVAVGRDASLQTHLFEDRVMKMGTVTLEAGATVGERAVVLYGASVGARAALAALSLVMKGERLPPGTSWAGVPAEPARRSLHLAQTPVAGVAASASEGRGRPRRARHPRHPRITHRPGPITCSASASRCEQLPVCARWSCRATGTGATRPHDTPS